MVAQTAKEAKDHAKRYTNCTPGMCLMYTRTWLGIPSRDFSAAAAWENAIGKHPGDRTPPAGAPVFWLGGSRGYGHIGLFMNEKQGTFRGTDMEYAGQISTRDLGWVDQHWGASQNYAGWAEGFNGIVIPYLQKPESQWASGDVYVAKLHKGVSNSDSVARLCYRLRHHQEIPGSHRPPHQGNSYGPEILEGVRYWQRKIMASDVPGPTDGTSLSNAQSNRLFTDAYHVLEAEKK